MFPLLKSLQQWRQILTTLSANYVMIIVGICMVWSSPVLEELHGAASPLARSTSTQQDEWITSLMLLGGSFGPILCLPLTRYCGRRPIIIASTLPLIMGWLLAGLATNVYYLYAARFLWGCCMGIGFTVIPIYIGEIAEHRIRGALCSTFAQHVNVGFFLGYLVGRFASYHGFAIIGGVLSLVAIGLAWTLPETPLYLIYEGRNVEATAVLQKLRNQTEENVRNELKALETLVENEYRSKAKISDLWSSRGNVKALGLCIVLCMLLQLVGINVILFQLQELFVKVKVKMSPADAPLVIGAMLVISSSITPLVIDRIGRRFLLYSTMIVMTFTLSFMGIYTMLETHMNYDLSSVTYLPMLLLIVYMMTFTWGIGGIPFVLVSEMFQLKIKCLASAICATLCWFSGFLLTRFYSDLTNAYGEYTGFWFLAVFCLFGAVFSYCLLPETKGKTFDEIQDILNNRTHQKSQIKFHLNNDC